MVDDIGDGANSSTLVVEESMFEVELSVVLRPAKYQYPLLCNSLKEWMVCWTYSSAVGMISCYHVPARLFDLYDVSNVLAHLC